MKYEIVTWQHRPSVGCHVKAATTHFPGTFEKRPVGWHRGSLAKNALALRDRVKQFGALCAPGFSAEAVFLCCALDRFLLTKANTFLHNREASAARLRCCSR
jgi:hypothetical protein